MHRGLRRAELIVTREVSPHSGAKHGHLGLVCAVHNQAVNGHVKADANARGGFGGRSLGGGEGSGGGDGG